MNAIDMSVSMNRFSWRWAFVTYCYLVLFHLFLSYYLLYPGMTFTFTAGSTGTFVWLGVGIVIVSTYISFRSVTMFLLEPALAALFYCLTIVLLYSDHIPNYFNYTLATRIAILILYAILGFIPAAMMAWSRMKAGPSKQQV